MDTQKYKKDSLFSSVFPQAEPSPAPAPAAAPQPHRPTVSEDQVSALNKKIELLERNIVGELQKKLAERAEPPPPPPAPPSPATPALIAKITEMDQRFREFQDKFLLGAAQMKNIEESKISARREIEELLKVVREQQKYSELDRQMHDQLQKAWSRVEEMEQRLIEAYSAASKRPAEPAPHPAPPPAPAVSADEIAAAVMKAVDKRLDERLRPLEELLRKVHSKAERAPEDARALAFKLEEQRAVIDSGVGALLAETKQLAIGAFAGKERLEDALAEMKAELKSQVKEEADRSGALFLRHSDAAALESRERLDAMARMLVSHIDSLVAAQAAASLKITELAAGLKETADSQRRAAAESAEGVERSLRKDLASLAEQIRAENAGQLERLKEVFHLSASGQAALSEAAGAVAALEPRFAKLLKAVGAVMADLRAVNLEGMLGVSGAVLRRNLETLPALCEEIRGGAALIAGKRVEIEAGVKRLRSDGGEK